MPGDLALLHRIEETIEIPVPEDLAVSGVFPAPFINYERLPRAVVIGGGFELVLVEIIQVLREEVEAGILKLLFCFLLSRGVSEGYRAPERIQPIAQSFSFAEILHREPGLVAEKPAEYRGRVPIPTDCAFQNPQARFDLRARHCRKFYLPIAWLFGDEQS